MLILMIMHWLGLAAAIQVPGTATWPELHIRICAEPPISNWTVSAAIAEAARILEQSQIRYVWLMESWDAACLPKDPQAELAVRIVNYAPANAARENLARATWSGLQRTAVIYKDRAAEFQSHGALVHLALGRAMAHEITHLLLPPERSHTLYGLMRPQWTPQDFGILSGAKFVLADSAVREMREEAERMERLREHQAVRVESIRSAAPARDQSRPPGVPESDRR